MKATLFVLLSLLAMSVDAHLLVSEKTYRLKDHKLRGNVKSISQDTYTVKKSTKKTLKIEKYNSVFDYSEMVFNEKGERIKMVSSSGTSSIKYNEKGHIIEAIAISNIDTTTTIANYIYKYNDQGVVIEEQILLNGELYYTFKVKYDDRGNIIEFIDDTNKGHYKTITWTFKYDYDDKGNILKHTTNSYPHPIKSYTYDSTGRMIEMCSLENDGSVSERNYYDSLGRLIQSVDYYSQRNYKYDLHDNLTEEVSYNKDNNSTYKTSYEYKYDSKGNSIEKIESRWNKEKQKYVPILIYKRDIVYF